MNEPYRNVLKALSDQAQVVFVYECADDLYYTFCRVVLPEWWPSWKEKESTDWSNNNNNNKVSQGDSQGKHQEIWWHRKSFASRLEAKEGIDTAVVNAMPYTLPFITLRTLFCGMEEPDKGYLRNWVLRVPELKRLSWYLEFKGFVGRMARTSLCGGRNCFLSLNITHVASIFRLYLIATHYRSARALISIAPPQTRPGDLLKQVICAMWGDEIPEQELNPEVIIEECRSPVDPAVPRDIRMHLVVRLPSHLPEKHQWIRRGCYVEYPLKKSPFATPDSPVILSQRACANYTHRVNRDTTWIYDTIPCNGNTIDNIKAFETSVQGTVIGDFAFEIAATCINNDASQTDLAKDLLSECLLVAVAQHLFSPRGLKNSVLNFSHGERIESSRRTLIPGDLMDKHHHGPLVRAAPLNNVSSNSPSSSHCHSKSPPAVKKRAFSRPDPVTDGATAFKKNAVPVSTRRLLWQMAEVWRPTNSTQSDAIAEQHLACNRTSCYQLIQPLLSVRPWILTPNKLVWTLNMSQLPFAIKNVQPLETSPKYKCIQPTTSERDANISLLLWERLLKFFSLGLEGGGGEGNSGDEIQVHLEPMQLIGERYKDLTQHEVEEALASWCVVRLHLTSLIRGKLQHFIDIMSFQTCDAAGKWKKFYELVDAVTDCRMILRSRPDELCLLSSVDSLFIYGTSAHFEMVDLMDWQRHVMALAFARCPALLRTNQTEKAAATIRSRANLTPFPKEFQTPDSVFAVLWDWLIDSVRKDYPNIFNDGDPDYLKRVLSPIIRQSLTKVCSDAQWVALAASIFWDYRAHESRSALLKRAADAALPVVPTAARFGAARLSIGATRRAVEVAMPTPPLPNTLRPAAMQLEDWAELERASKNHNHHHQITPSTA